MSHACIKQRRPQSGAQTRAPDAPTVRLMPETAAAVSAQTERQNEAENTRPSTATHTTFPAQRT